MSQRIEYNDNSLREGCYKYGIKKVWHVPFTVGLELEVLVRTQSVHVYV